MGVRQLLVESTIVFLIAMVAIAFDVMMDDSGPATLAALPLWLLANLIVGAMFAAPVTIVATLIAWLTARRDAHRWLHAAWRAQVPVLPLWVAHGICAAVGGHAIVEFMGSPLVEMALVVLVVAVGVARGERAINPPRKRARGTWRCASCGYDQRGLRTDICPECGNPPRPMPS